MDGKLFDVEGVEVFISKKCSNNFLSGIYYLLNLPNVF